MTILNKILKYLVMKQLTNNLGKIVEYDDIIVCYVKKVSTEKEYSNYYYRCYGIDGINEDLVNKYKLNKPITYIFDELDFSKNKVVIFGYNGTNILIKNCKFNRELIVTNPKGSTVLENTIIKIFLNLNLSSSNLTFKNMDIATEEDILFGKKVSVLLNGDNIKIVNSKIGDSFDKKYISIHATNEIQIINSKIDGNEVEISSHELISDDSFIHAKEILAIDLEKASDLNIESPEILINEDINKNPIEIEISKKRRDLLKVLKNIKSQCEILNNYKLEEYKNTLNNQEVSKVLKK